MELNAYLFIGLFIAIIIIFRLLFLNNKKNGKISLLKSEIIELENKDDTDDTIEEDLNCDKNQLEIDFYPTEVFEVLLSREIEPGKFYITYIDNTNNPGYFYFDAMLEKNKKFAFLLKYPTNERFLKEIKS